MLPLSLPVQPGNPGRKKRGERADCCEGQEDKERTGGLRVHPQEEEAKRLCPQSKSRNRNTSVFFRSGGCRAKKGLKE